ncbi:hypothetical protein BJV77DRAFT_968273 [Russula vinacea]|nr:hypothetical protein BJV77DRAFT_968273 [Russula vinacea]
MVHKSGQSYTRCDADTTGNLHIYVQARAHPDAIEWEVEYDFGAFVHEVTAPAWHVHPPSATQASSDIRGRVVRGSAQSIVGKWLAVLLRTFHGTGLPALAALTETERWKDCWGETWGKRKTKRKSGNRDNKETDNLQVGSPADPAHLARALQLMPGAESGPVTKLNSE